MSSVNKDICFLSIVHTLISFSLLITIILLGILSMMLKRSDGAGSILALYLSLQKSFKFLTITYDATCRDGWMASLTGWTWVWVNSRSWWWTGRPGMLRFMGSQRVGHDWATEQNCRGFGEGNGTPLQYSCLENPMDGEAWKATVHGVTKCRTRLSNFTFTVCLRCTAW